MNDYGRLWRKRYMKTITSLYFHLPFCSRKCPYCHFYVIGNKDSFKDLLLEGLKLEWKQKLPLLKDCIPVSLYFGGGTPFLFGPMRLKAIIDEVLVSFPHEHEITLEVNPENATKSQLEEYYAIGVNRLSIGVQSFDPQLLKTLGRQHSAEQSHQAIEWAYEAGFTNVSLDLMYEIPGQTLQSWKETLCRLDPLPFQHLSLYNLVFEPDTPFYKKRESLQRSLPDQETSVEMYQLICDKLNDLSFKQYEISAFAKSGRISKHNIGYWTGRPFLGLGPSAFSYWEGRRFQNIPNLQEYCHRLNENQDPTSFTETLTPEARLRELLAINLRLIDGVNIHTFQQSQGKIDESLTHSLIKLIQNELIIQNGDNLALTPKGRLFYDEIASEII